VDQSKYKGADRYGNAPAKLAITTAPIAKAIVAQMKTTVA
jgi:hypothetical protein